MDMFLLGLETFFPDIIQDSGHRFLERRDILHQGAPDYFQINQMIGMD
jgi:hypothetical protein